MKLNKRAGVLLLAGLLMLGLAAGCRSGKSAPTPSEQPAEPFHLSVCLAPNPETMDPALNSTLDGGIMLQHLFEGLMKYVSDGKGNAVLAPGQAASYVKTQEDDGSVTYTFTLREDIYWSDGQPVTADDFCYAWRRLMDPATGAAYSYVMDMVEGAPEVMMGQADPETLGVSAPDPKTFVVRLNYDCPYFLELCAFPALFPVRRDILEKHGAQWIYNPETYVSNGIYRMSRWDQNDRLVMVPNEYHYDVENLGPDSITFRFSDDETAVYQSFRAGELDFIERVPAGEIPQLAQKGLFHTADYIATYFVAFQNNRAPFDDPRVRKAFTLAIDSGYITSVLTATGEVPATGFVPSGVYDAGGAAGEDFRAAGGDYWQAPVKEEIYQANCQQARALLAEAGYPGGQGFPVVEYLYPTDEGNRIIAEALQSMWAQELGVTVNLANQDWGSVLEACFMGEYYMASMVWGADFNDPISFLSVWHSQGGNNILQYSNRQFDELVEQAAAMQDPQARMKAMHQAEDLLIGEDCALAPVYFDAQYYCANPALQGLYYSPLGYFFFGYAYLQ